MRLKVIIGLVVCTAAFLLVAQDEVLRKLSQAGGVKITTTGGDVKIRILDSTQTLPWMEFGSQTNIAFSLPATGIIPVLYGGTGAATAAGARTNLGIGSGLTTNILCFDGATTNQLQFTLGVLTGVVPQ